MHSIEDRCRADSRSDDELFDVVLTETDDERHSHAVFTLRYRGTREIYDTAIGLCRGRLAVERRQGVSVLSLFRGKYGKEHPFHQETLDLLRGMLEREKRITVIHMLLWGLSQLDDDRAVRPIAELTNHANKWIRKSVAIALTSFAGESEHALRALIDMCRDPDRDVRDWATFGLGSQFELGNLDLPEAHEVLWERAEEEDREIRSQALRGLVFRGDNVPNERLIAELQADELYDDILEAVEMIADPVFLPYLLRLREWREIPHSLEDAIAACGGEAERKV